VITTYAELLNHLAKMVTFDGENTGDASVGTLQALLSIAETRIYRELETSHTEVPFSGTVSGGKFALPAEFRTASVVHFGRKALEPVSYEWLRDYLLTGDNGECRYFARLGNDLYFAPVVADGTAVQGTYYSALPALSESTIASNGLFTDASDLFIYAVMVEAAPMYGFQDQLTLWESKYQQVRDNLNTGHKREIYNAGRMKRRPSTTLMG
jgi:hypothetical protein